MDMVYHWRLTPPGKELHITIENHRKEREFDAALSLRALPLTREALRKQLWRLPLMTAKTALTIYWQAVKLWLKRAPVYSHPPVDKD
ncbi:DUF1365 family protein, partial [Rahnella sp. Larv3_ips]